MSDRAIIRDSAIINSFTISVYTDNHNPESIIANITASAVDYVSMSNVQLLSGKYEWEKAQG